MREGKGKGKDMGMGNMARTLQLVHAAGDETAAGPTRSAAERLFDHWVWMLGKNPRRVAFGPARRKVVAAALGLYDEAALRLAIEGCSASAWHAGDNDRGEPFNDIELILRDEKHIERFMRYGERLHELAAQQDDAPAEAAAPPEADPAAAAAGRERLRALAAELAGRTSGGPRRG